MTVIYDAEEPPTELDLLLHAGAVHRRTMCRGLTQRKFYRMVVAFAQAGDMSFEEGLRLITMGDQAWANAKYPPRGAS